MRVDRCSCEAVRGLPSMTAGRCPSRHRHDSSLVRNGNVVWERADGPMANEHPLHVDGMAADHAEWTVDLRDDDFDATALERAMVSARESAYSELAALDAA